MSKLDGGPAFPVEGFGNPQYCAPGMTLRAWFAGQALVGGLAYCGDGQRGSWHNNASPEGVATMCYAYADAMLREMDR